MKQLTALSAVVLILLGNHSTSADNAIKTFTYKTVGDRPLQIHIHYPPEWKETDSRPVIVFFFGGGWNAGSTNQFLDQAAYFASRGMVTARADYRVKSRDGITPDQCVADARSAVRWIRKNAKKLGINPNKLVASGGSAGGHLAACTMMQDSVETEGDDLSISTVPQAMVLFNPVLSFEHDMLIDRLGDKKDLARKISPTAHLTAKSPPALILFGTDDKLKLFGDQYWKKAEALGVRADKYLATDQGHGFFNHSPWKEKTMLAADEFLVSLGILDGEPTANIPEISGRKQPATDRPAGQERDRNRSAANWLRTMDGNNDRKIGKDEARNRIRNNFDRIDTSADGFLDRKELEALAQRFAGRRSRPARQRVHPDSTNWSNLFEPDLSNAIYPEDVWTIEDGELTASEDQAVWTKRRYDNFVLDLEFRTADGTNSGVIVYCSDIDNWIPNSVEIQIADDHSEKWGNADKTWQCGAVFGRLAAAESRVKKPGEWNRFTIRCVDRQINVALNGARIVSMDMSRWTSPDKNPDGTDIPSWLSKPLAELPTMGRIGLQGKHAGAPVWFRNIKVRELR